MPTEIAPKRCDMFNLCTILVLQDLFRIPIHLWENSFFLNGAWHVSC